MSEKINLTWMPNPLTQQGKVHHAIAVSGETLYQYCMRMGFRVQGEIAADVNGVQIPHWKNYVLREGDNIVLRRAVAGGGDSDPLQLVAMVAVIALTYGVGTAMAGAYSAGAIQAAQAVTMIGGQMLANMLVPPPKANATADKKDQFSLNGWGNTARPYEPLPMVMGKHRFAFDIASQPFTRYEKGEQYLYQSFCYGAQEDSRVTALKIGDTPIGDFQGVELFYSDPTTGELPNIFYDVDSTEGGKVLYGTPLLRTSAEHAKRLELDMIAVGYTSSQKNGVQNGWVKARIEYRPVGSGTWLAWLQDRTGWVDENASTQISTYPNQAVPSGTEFFNIHNVATNWALTLQVSPSNSSKPYILYKREKAKTPEGFIAASGNRGGSYGNGTEFLAGQWLPLVPDGETGNTFTGNKSFSILNGLPIEYEIGIASAIELGESLQSELDTDLSTTNSPAAIWQVECDGANPFRDSIAIEVPEGQYEVRITKLTADSETSSNVNLLSAPVLKTYQRIAALHRPYIKRLGVRVKASENLSGGIDNLSAIIENKALVRSGSTWVRDYTSNPASWFREILIGKFIPTGERIYGCGYLPEEIDDANLIEWYDFCAANNLELNLRVQSNRTLGDTIAAITRAGKAIMTRQTGKIGVIYEDPSLSPVAVFSPSNMIAGSFKINWNTSDLADEVVATFNNKDKNYEPDQVRVVNPSVIAPKQAATVDLDGITTPAQAAKAANLYLANNIYHRRLITWETDIEGMVAQRGQVVLLSHDLTSWSESGRILSINSPLSFNITQDVAAATNGYIGIRAPDGTYATTRGDINGTVLTLYSWPVELMDTPTDTDSLDWMWFFEPNTVPCKKVRITAVEPQDEYTIKYTARDEDPDYYNAENGTFVIGDWDTKPIPVNTVSELKLVGFLSNPVDGTYSATMSWTKTIVAAPTTVEVFRNGKSVIFQRTSDLSVSGDLKYGDKVRVIVTPLADAGTLAGDPVEQTFTVQDWPTYNNVFPKATTAEIFATPDELGHINKAKVRLDFDNEFPFLPDGLAVCYSVSDAVNSVYCTGLYNGSNRMLIVEPKEESNGVYEILSGSDRNKIRVREPYNPFPSDLNVAGQYWAALSDNKYRKAIKNDGQYVYFDEAFDIDPVVGGMLMWSEITWQDTRNPANRYLIAFDGSGNYEIIRWISVEQLPDNRYVLYVERAQEGTTMISNSTPTTLYYLPMEGQGTVQVNIPANSFVDLGDGVVVANTDLDLLIPAGGWASVSCYVYKITQWGVQRSPIQPMKYGGNL